MLKLLFLEISRGGWRSQPAIKQLGRNSLLLVDCWEVKPCADSPLCSVSRRCGDTAVLSSCG